jgi:hypothetical protein
MKAGLFPALFLTTRRVRGGDGDNGGLLSLFVFGFLDGDGSVNFRVTSIVVEFQVFVSRAE